MTVKAAGIAIALIAAFQASATYKRDVEEKFLDLKIKIAQEALTAAGGLTRAKDWPSHEQALYRFGVVKHGGALAVFTKDSPIYLAMVTYWNHCVDYESNPGQDKNPEFDHTEPAFEALSDVFHDKLFATEQQALTKKPNSQ
jgi:hypothetical protein